MLRGTLGGLSAGTVLFLAVLGALFIAFDSEAESPSGQAVSEAASSAAAGDSASASSQSMDDSKPSLEIVRPPMPDADESSGLTAGADGSSQ